MNTEKLHQYAVWALAILSVFCFLLVFSDNEKAEQALAIWFIGFSIYLLIYILDANQRGKIVSRFGDIEKKDTPIKFRMALALYLFFALLMLVLFVSMAS